MLLITDSSMPAGHRRTGEPPRSPGRGSKPGMHRDRKSSRVRLWPGPGIFLPDLGRNGDRFSWRTGSDPVGDRGQAEPRP